MENIQNYGTFTYYSDSDSQFERAFAYIIKDDTIIIVDACHAQNMR